MFLGVSVSNAFKIEAGGASGMKAGSYLGSPVRSAPSVGKSGAGDRYMAG